MNLATPFATTITGEIVIPFIGGLLLASVISGFVWFVKTSKRLTTQDMALVQILNVIQPEGRPSLVETLARINATLKIKED